MTSSPKKAAVEAYFEGFRRGDHAAILALLTDDVRWDLPGFRHLTGKEDFDGEIVNEAFEGQPLLVIERLFEDGNVVVAVGTGDARQKTGETFRFAYNDIFTFRGHLIERVESYVVPTND
jgi:ketosteroid isomerase-like protein